LAEFVDNPEFHDEDKTDIKIDRHSCEYVFPAVLHLSRSLTIFFAWHICEKLLLNSIRRQPYRYRNLALPRNYCGHCHHNDRHWRQTRSAFPRDYVGRLQSHESLSLSFRTLVRQVTLGASQIIHVGGPVSTTRCAVAGQHQESILGRLFGVGFRLAPNGRDAPTAFRGSGGLDLDRVESFLL
jgi:hypothetical protein